MDKQQVIRSAGVVGFFTMLSRGFGLVRDILMAAFFGSSLAMDAYVVAFTIPNLFRALFGEGALSASFIPVFTETRRKEGPARCWQLAADIFSILSLVLASLVLIGVTLAWLASLFLPLSPHVALIMSLLRIMLPYMFFICLAALFAAMLNSLQRFALPASAPVMFNLVMIAVLLLVCPRFDPAGGLRIYAVAWGVIAAGVIQWLMQLPAVWRLGFRPRFSFNWHGTGVRRVVSLMGVAMIGVGIVRLNVVLDRVLAIFTGVGGPSYLYYSERLIFFPLAIFATALGTVLLPAFSGHAAQAQLGRIKETVNHSIRQLLFVMLPAAVGIFVLARPIICAVYQRGDFSAETTQMTAWALQCYAPGLIVFGMLKIFIPVFYALQDMKTVVRVGIACTVLNIILSLILMWPMKHAGIALSTVLASTVNLAILGYLAQRRLGSLGWGRILVGTARMAAAAALMAVVALWAYHWLEQKLLLSTLTANWRQIVSLLGSILAAVLAYAGGAFICRCPEIVELWTVLRRWRQKT